MEGPSALGRVFAASKRAARAEQRQAEYEQALASYTAAAQQHSQRLEKARLKHGADVARLAEQHRQKVEEISALQRGLAALSAGRRRSLPGPRAGGRRLSRRFPPTRGTSRYAAASGHLAIEYEMPQMDVVPNDKAYRYVKSSDTISPTARPATQVRSIYAETLRQTALRVVHEVPGGRPRRRSPHDRLQRIRQWH